MSQVVISVHRKPLQRRSAFPQALVKLSFMVCSVIADTLTRAFKFGIYKVKDSIFYTQRTTKATTRLRGSAFVVRIRKNKVFL